MFTINDQHNDYSAYSYFGVKQCIMFPADCDVTYPKSVGCVLTFV